jgi:hypothetical protein
MAKSRAIIRYRSRPRKHHRAKMTIPLAIVAGFAPGIIDTIKNGMKYGWVQGSDSGLTTLLGDYTGVQTYDAQRVYNQGAWSTWRLKYGLYPMLGGFAAHWLASKFGINRMLARSRIPFIRI